ncbi:hypothetical protein [Flavobacterium panacagri]|uniref:hypothetical protein n=1 Tax=Flavobacterium panacagri TaxID=3034146 RepID=UPI0025A58562|nr:hypothetical protein [Flavobacterium panacagri]
MKKNIGFIIIMALITVVTVKAQVGMPLNSPIKDAILDLNYSTTGTTNKGLLLPKVSLLATDNPSPLKAHTAGIYVYNTNPAGSGATQVVKGTYYNDGSRWYSVNGSTIPWTTGGNAGTNATSNFVGTTDAVDFVTVTNGIERNRVTAAGKLLVGTTTVPTGGTNAKVILNSSATGALQLQDGTQQLSYGLISDANGVGQWQMQAINKNIATLSTAGVNVPITPLDKWYYTNTSITLAPGKWLINVNMLLSRASAPVFNNSNEFLWANATFSNSSTTLTPTTDILTTGNLMGAPLYPSAKNGMMTGNLIIRNSGTVNKTYYFIVKINGRNLSGTGLSKFGGGWPEDYIWYQKIP